MSITFMSMILLLALVVVVLRIVARLACFALTVVLVVGGTAIALSMFLR